MEVAEMRHSGACFIIGVQVMQNLHRLEIASAPNFRPQRIVVTLERSVWARENRVANRQVDATLHATACAILRGGAVKRSAREPNLTYARNNRFPIDGAGSALPRPSSHEESFHAASSRSRHHHRQARQARRVAGSLQGECAQCARGGGLASNRSQPSRPRRRQRPDPVRKALRRARRVPDSQGGAPRLGRSGTWSRHRRPRRPPPRR
jgi:hypothetical protein